MKKILVSFFVFILVSVFATSAAFAFTTLKVGSKGDAVKKVQTVLKNHNFKVKVDGKYGSSTAKYVKSFQKMHHISADGKVGEKTWDYMMNDYVVHNKQLKQPKTKLPLKQGAKNDDVKFVQSILKAHGYKVKVDGKYGSGTTKYVRLYQKAHFLHVDGAVGDKTWKSMAVSYKIYPYVWDYAKIVPTKSRFPVKSGSAEADVIAIKKALELKDPEQDLVLHVLDGSGQPVKDAQGQYTYTGVYDQATINAVTVFQTVNKLIATGKDSKPGEVGMYTWEALVATDTDKYYVSLLANIIDRESGGAKDNEQIGIACTVMDYAKYMSKTTIENELKGGSNYKSRYSPCDSASEWAKFVDQAKKFSKTSRQYKNAMRAYYGLERIFGTKKVYYFHATYVVPPPGAWWWDCEFFGRVDKHIFYGVKLR